MALLCKVQRLPLAKQSGYTFKEALTQKLILYCWLFGVGCDILSSPHFQHHLYFISITTITTAAPSTTAPTTSIPSPSIITPSIESSQPSSAFAPPVEILDQAIRITVTPKTVPMFGSF